MACPIPLWPTVSTSKASPVVHTMAAENPCRRRPLTRTPILDPAQSMAVAPARANRPTNRGSLLEGDLSASQPHNAEGLSRDLNQEQRLSFTHAKSQACQLHKLQVKRIPNVGLCTHQFYIIHEHRKTKHGSIDLPSCSGMPARCESANGITGTTYRK